MRRPLNPSRPRISVTTGRNLLPVLEQLAISDTRTASQMARRLNTEALAYRGLWDLEHHRPAAWNVVEFPGPWLQ